MIHDNFLILCIQSIGSFIKEQVSRMLVNRSGNWDTLLLSLTDRIAVGTDFGVIFRR